MGTLDDLFVPDPPSGDSSNRIPTTRFVQSAIVSNATALFPQISSLSVVANLSTVAATAVGTSITAAIDQLIGSAQGNILYRNAASWVVLPVGNSGQFLQTQGAAANPQWATSALVLLNTLNASAVSTIGDTTSFTSTFKTFQISVIGLQVSNSGAGAYVQFHSSGAFQTSNYSSAFVLGGSAGIGSTGAILLTGNYSTDTSNGISTGSMGLSGNCFVFNPSVSSSNMIVLDTAYARAFAPGAMSRIMCGGAWNSSGVVDGLLVGVTTGTFTATIKIYGMN
jgi:hypothetical protein